MREIKKPDGSVYCTVEVSDGMLKMTLKGNYVMLLDAKIIPQLRQILAEAEFFKTV